MSDVRLAAILTDDQLAEELTLALVAKRDSDEDDDLEAIDEWLAELKSEAGLRWWHANRPRRVA
jgi:hypothetical protein